MRQRKTVKQKIAAFIDRSKSDVFMPRDFTQAKVNSAEYDTTLRAVRELVREGRLTRLSYGVYARTRRSPITGKPMLTAPGGFEGAVRQSLDKLGVKWTESKAIQDYNAGRSTQIPVSTSFRVESGFTRRFSYRGKEMEFDRTTI